MKRFYKDVATELSDTGHVVTLDGRIVKTPARQNLCLPTLSLAEAVADEWRAQGEKIVPDSMHVTRLANTAQDRVQTRHADVVAEVAAFAGTDLLCYRADEPAELIARQAATWDPYLAWLKDTAGIELEVTSGIMPVRQSDDALAGLTALVAGHGAFELTALHAFTTGFGSLVLALALMRGFTGFEAAWRASLVDAEFQEAEWGLDWETEDKRARLRAELEAAMAFLSHVRNK
ncbi:MAG: ATPase [Alphaproteobacteria bacterium]|nr:MAG: ATPase [Alphaproteobacteria bacterium]